MRSLLALSGSLVLSAVVSNTPAFAEEDEATASAPAASGEAAAADNAGAPQTAPVPPPIAPSTAPTQPAPLAAAPADQAAITAVGIERLKPSAYPGETRGIKGGSLALTFHGLQWPYMPARSGGSNFVLGVSGWVWDDISYARYTAGKTNTNKDNLDRNKATNQGRFVLRATPTWTSGDWFLQGQGEFVATTNQGIDRKEYGGADTDDLWLRVGMWNLGDVQIGRFEGWEVFHLGMGLDLNTFERKGAADSGYAEYYGLTDLQYRANSAGNVAVHLYPMDILRFEILGQVGSSTSQNSVGTRVVGIFDLGWFKLKGGAEYRKQTDLKRSSPGYDVSKGFGFSAQFVLNPWVECGLNFAQGYVDSWNEKKQHNFKGSFDRMSYGGFLNARLYFEDLVLGLGVINSQTRDLYQEAGNVDPNANNEFSHLQGFAALQYAIFKQFYVKVVGSYAKAEATVPLARDATKTDAEQIKSKTIDIKDYSIRVRFSYFY
jgi:hypothetical protein